MMTNKAVLRFVTDIELVAIAEVLGVTVLELLSDVEFQIDNAQ